MRSYSPTGAFRIAARASWTVVDQFLSAVSNLLLAILVARTLDAFGFGAFSTAFLVFSVALGLTRAAVGQPLQITFASAPPAKFRAAVRSALGAALIIGLGVGLLTIVSGLALASGTGAALVALGVCLPGLMVQDTCRMAFFSCGRPRSAAAIDALWAVLMFGALAVAVTVHTLDVWVPIAIWGAGATVAAVAGIGMLNARPHLPGAARWTWRQRRLSGYLIANILGQSLAQIGILMVAVLGTVAGVGALRAAQVLVGPLNILVLAAFMFAVPEIARRPSMSQRGHELFCGGVSVALGTATAIYCAALLLIPDSIGERLLGDTWVGAQSVMLPMCVLSLAAALGTGPAATLYGMGVARITFFINILKLPLLCALLLAGMVTSGALGVAWAIAITETLMLPLWCVKALRAMRTANDQRRSESMPSDHPATPEAQNAGPTSPRPYGP